MMRALRFGKEITTFEIIIYCDRNKRKSEKRKKKHFFKKYILKNVFVVRN